MTTVNKRFPQKALTVAIISASCGSVQLSHAQPVEEELVVTGIRASLTRALDIKRESNGVVDAISSEDIGKFPDTNLAESLQRITGVSIDRSNNEGNQVTVRGFGPSFNLVTVNNRQMPNSSALLQEGITRSFNFRELAAESVSGVEVYKTGKAHVPSGGIGATINIKTAKPFDYDGFKAAGSLKGVMDTSVEEGDTITPEISGMISQTFLDGKFGALLSVSHSERDSRREAVGTAGWVRNQNAANNPVDTSNINTNNNPTQTYWTPQTIDVDVADHERERQNGQLVLQFSPIDNLTATLNYTMSRLEEKIDLNRTSIWFDSVESGTADQNGTVINPRLSNDELNFWAWDYFLETENDSYGLNIDWQINDELNLSLDFHDSTSHSQPDGDASETIANLKNIIIDYPNGVRDGAVDVGLEIGGADVPSIIFDASDLPGGDPYAQDNIVADLFQKRGYEIENNIQQLQLQGKWVNGNEGLLASINFGLAHTEYDIDTYRSFTFAFVDPYFAGVDLDLSNLGLSFYDLGSFGDEISGSNNLFPRLTSYDAANFIDIVRDADLFNTNPPTTNNVSEETTSFYASVDLETEIADMPFAANIGFRYEETDVEAVSVQAGITHLNYRADDELQVVFDDEVSPDSLEGDYSRFLPNADLSMNFTDDIVGRISYSKTISRADISAMFPATSINNSRPSGPYQASQGNPNLLPLLSNNFDLSAEWYYEEGSYVSVGYFKKDVEDFIGATTESRPINDVNGNPLTDPSINARAGCPSGTTPANPDCLSQAGDPVISWEVSTPGNQGDAKIDGWEIAVQHMFGESGFGTIVNATFVDGDIEYDVFNLDGTRALAGLSDSANIIGFYEKHGFEIRLAYNWRDDFLLSIGQPQITGEPTFTEDYGQWDMNASYSFNDNLSVFFEGLNITEETTRRHGRFSNQLVAAEQFGARYNIGVRAKF